MSILFRFSWVHICPWCSLCRQTLINWNFVLLFCWVICISYENAITRISYWRILVFSSNYLAFLLSLSYLKFHLLSPFQYCITSNNCTLPIISTLPSYRYVSQWLFFLAFCCVHYMSVCYLFFFVWLLPVNSIMYVMCVCVI